MGRIIVASQLVQPGNLNVNAAFYLLQIHHLYLVFDPGDGSPRADWDTVEGYPGDNGQLTYLNFPFNDPQAGSFVHRPPAPYGDVVVYSGADAVGKWQDIKRVAAEIGDEFKYSNTVPITNSNSFVQSVLFQAGLQRTLPSFGFAAGTVWPGTETLLGVTSPENLSIDAITTNIFGGRGSDHLFGKSVATFFRLYGGVGDDTLRPGSGGFLSSTLHGGQPDIAYAIDGLDTADYSDSLFPLRVVILNDGNQEHASPEITVVRATLFGGKDKSYSIEKLRLSEYADQLSANSLSGRWIDRHSLVDGGAEKDVLNLEQVAYDIFVDLRDAAAQVAKYGPGDKSLHLKNFESVLGGYGSDNVRLRSGTGTVKGTDPLVLVLDLDADGLELTRVSNNSPFFDIDGDGARERTAWVKPDDGLLARDVNGNGRIDGVAELFGTGDTSGFSALSALDDNADGVIDAADAAFASLLVWRDLESDGVTDAGELASLLDTDITSISLVASDPAEGEEEIEGNEVLGVGHFTWADGRTGAAYDVALAYLDGSGASPRNPDNQDGDPDNDTTSDPTAPESNAEFDGEADGGEGEDTVDYSTFEEALTATVNADGTVIGETEYVKHKLTNIEIVLGTRQADTLKATGISDKALTIDLGANEAPAAPAASASATQQRAQDTIDLSGMSTSAGFVVDLRNPDAQFFAENIDKVPLVSNLNYDPQPLASALSTNPNLQLLGLNGSGSLASVFGSNASLDLSQYATDARVNVKNAEVVAGSLSEQQDIVLGVDHRLYNQGVTDFLDLDLRGGNDRAFFTSSSGNVKGGAGSDIILAVNGAATGPADVLTVDGGADHDAGWQLAARSRGRPADLICAEA